MEKTEKHPILIVDDEAETLSLLKKALLDEDLEIFTATNAEEGLKIIEQKGEMEVIISDNKLPGMQGLDFLIKVKKAYPETVRILITGYPDLAGIMRAANTARIWRYLTKPLDITKIRDLLDLAFDYFRVLKENRILLQIAREQMDHLKLLKETIPAEHYAEIEDTCTKNEHTIKNLIKNTDVSDKPEIAP